MITNTVRYSNFLDSHLKPFRCRVDSCKGMQFTDIDGVLRHERELHRMHGVDKRLLCPYSDCARGVPGNEFKRPWNRNDHIRRIHTKGQTRRPNRKARANNSPRLMSQFQIGENQGKVRADMPLQLNATDIMSHVQSPPPMSFCGEWFHTQSPGPLCDLQFLGLGDSLEFGFDLVGEEYKLEAR